ncbi:hypothetical protein PFBG_05362 [Plasmodium falciparum 7G8]|uniref:Importin N-terminal domain-containing protein n=1 Tax=Plasmodium falciparum (isolate 7G8) TaxID=57266 RepID=W7F7P1_PLAF8|nr:hypothetical protein PFBG_05362 [Plasmodium falciparum 7G8]
MEEIEEKYKIIIDALYDTWSNDHDKRKESEKILYEIEKDEKFIICLFDIYTSKSIHYNIRKLGIIYCKNLIVRYWNNRDGFHYSDNTKKIIKKKILDILNNVEYLNNYREFSILLKRISRYELVHNYPELLDCLLYNINIHKTNINNIYIYIYLLYKILREQYSKKLFKDKKETFDISEKFIKSLEFFWNNSINLYFQNNATDIFCMCNDEKNCNKCKNLNSLINLYEKQLFVSNVDDTIRNEGTANENIPEDENYYIHDKKIHMMKYLDSIILNLIINRNDIKKVNNYVNSKMSKENKGDQENKVDQEYKVDSEYKECKENYKNKESPNSSNNTTTTTNNNNNNNNNNNVNVNDTDLNIRTNFLNAFINKIIYYLKFINNNSASYYLKYLKFLLTSFFLMIEFHTSFHVYLKKDITEKLICLFLKKNLSLNNYTNDYEHKFIEIVNLCISILKSIFYHFCLNQYNLIKQKKVRENYINVKNIMCNKNINIENYNVNTLESKIINNFMINVKSMENENNILFNKNLSLKDILTYIREEVKQALSNDEFILIHNEKALEIFYFLRIYCINISSEQIIEVTLNIRDDYETEENIFYNNAKDCIIELSSEPFLFSIFHHFFEPLINSFHNYVHFLKGLPVHLKNIQIPEFSSAIIQLDGYLNIYYILYPSFHKKIKIEHILCMIRFFMDFLNIKYTHPLISYRIALIIKIWTKSYKTSFPFIEDLILLIYENIRFLYIQLLQKNVVSLITENIPSYVNDMTFQHYAIKSVNFLPILFFKFISLFKYFFKYEYVYKNYDYINEFLVSCLINVLTKITYPKNIQKILKILSHIVFMSNKEKDITIFKDNYNFLLDLYMNSNISIKEYILNILVQILNKNYEYVGSLVEYMNKENYHNDNNKVGVNEKVCDDIVLFYFSYDIILYTLSAKIEKQPFKDNIIFNHPHIPSEYKANHNINNDITSDINSDVNNNINNFQFNNIYNNLINFPYIKEINLDIDKTISDNFYSLWICILKLIYKMFHQKKEEIVKKICSFYIATINYLYEYFKNQTLGKISYELSNLCLDVVIEYMCLFIIHETHNFYLTYESINIKMLTNDIIKSTILKVVEFNFILNDEIKIEKCIYILHLCLSIYKNDMKNEKSIIYTYIAQFVIIYLLKVLLKYFSKYFNFYNYIQQNQNKRAERNDANKNYNLHSNNNNNFNDDVQKNGNVIFDEYKTIGEEKSNRNKNNIPDISFDLQGNNTNNYYLNHFKNDVNNNDNDDNNNNKNNDNNNDDNNNNNNNNNNSSSNSEQINNKLNQCNKNHIKYIYDNIINYQHDENFLNEFTHFQNDVKKLFNINYINDYDITKTFLNFNFSTINEDNYSYINKHSVFTLISILSLYEPNYLNYILITFLTYFKINIPIFIFSFFYQSQYIHNKNILNSLLIFIYILTQNYILTPFPSIFLQTNFPSITNTQSFEKLMYDTNKNNHLFTCNKDEHTLLIIEILKLINNILNTNKDIYIEKKNILHLSTISTNLNGTKIFHSYNYNYILRKVLKYDDFANICSRALDNILTYLIDTNNVEDNNRKNIIVNYLKDNIDDMNSAIVDMYKKYKNFF